MILQIYLSAVSGIAGEALIFGFWLMIFFTVYRFARGSFKLFEIAFLGSWSVDNSVTGFIVGAVYGIVPGLVTGLIIGLSGIESSAAAGLISVLSAALPMLGLCLLGMLTNDLSLHSIIYNWLNEYLPFLSKILLVLAVPAIAAGIVLVKLIPVILRHNS